MTQQILVEVVYALPDIQVIEQLRVPKGTTAQEAIIQSGILNKFPEIELANHRIGIYGKLISNTTLLAHRDRIEIYRPLLIDPKDARRKRAAL